MNNFRPMYKSDTAQVVKLIHKHDEDDADAAHNDFDKAGVENQYVFELDDNVIGISGFRKIPATDRTAWVSWTYLDPKHCGKGIGKAMFEKMLDAAKTDGCRKLFVKVSDYCDPEDGDIYAAALKMYQSFGFKLEVTNLDFYDSKENQLILGLELEKNDADPQERLKVQEEKPIIRFNGLFEIAETEDAYSFQWTVDDKKSLWGKRNFTVEDLNTGLEAAKSAEARQVFLTFPSNLPLIHQPLQSAGFKYVGSLLDYYELGVDDMHFVHRLND